MRNRACFFAVICCVAAFSSSGAAQDWNGFRWLTGRWAGEGSGKPGQSSGSFSLLPDLGGKILLRKGHAIAPPRDGSAGIVHDDLLIISPGDGGAFRGDYYDNEGHVIRYGISIADSSIVMLSARTGKGPVFRLTYFRLAGGLVDVRFEMSPDGTAFTVYTEGKCRREEGD